MIRKIYTGWILEIEGKEFTVAGSIKIRNTQWVLVKNSNNEDQSIRRNDIVSGINDGSIKYIGNA